MQDKLKQKIKELPKSPGVYIYRNSDGRVIYVGKAVNLKNRVSSYFKGVYDTPKTEQLVKNIFNLEYIETDSEVSALILEAELVKRYRPKFNIELKDDKNYLYLKIPKEDFPLPVFVRNPEDDKALYIGPFTDARTVRRVLKILRKVFPFRSKGDLNAKRACLYYHLGQCPGVCIGAISKTDYAKNIRKIVGYFEGKGGALEKQYEKEMKQSAKSHHFEEASLARDKLINFKRIKELHIQDTIATGLKEDKALKELQLFLNLKEQPRRIECFDISNIVGQYAVGSMVVFINGLPAKREYRKFKIRGIKTPDDPAMMGEVLSRRFKRIEKEEKREVPDLIVIDGGKGQLSVVRRELEKYDLEIPIIGLAKRFEEIWTSSQLSAHSAQEDKLGAVSRELGAKYEKIILPQNSEALYLLQRIRDEAHRFAITYYRSIHQKVAKKSILDGIPGVGPKTKKKLLRHFGSVVGIKEASNEDLEQVVGEKIARTIRENL